MVVLWVVCSILFVFFCCLDCMELLLVVDCSTSRIGFSTVLFREGTRRCCKVLCKVV